MPPNIIVTLYRTSNNPIRSLRGPVGISWSPDSSTPLRVGCTFCPRFAWQSRSVFPVTLTY